MPFTEKDIFIQIRATKRDRDYFKAMEVVMQMMGAVMVMMGL